MREPGWLVGRFVEPVGFGACSGWQVLILELCRRMGKGARCRAWRPDLLLRVHMKCDLTLEGTTWPGR